MRWAFDNALQKKILNATQARLDSARYANTNVCSVKSSYCATYIVHPGPVNKFVRIPGVIEFKLFPGIAAFQLRTTSAFNRAELELDVPGVLESDTSIRLLAVQSQEDKRDGVLPRNPR